MTGDLGGRKWRCSPEADRELYAGMMALTEIDIATMRAIKTALDPAGYLNPAVLFGD